MFVRWADILCVHVQSACGDIVTTVEANTKLCLSQSCHLLQTHGRTKKNFTINQPILLLHIDVSQPGEINDCCTFHVARERTCAPFLAPASTVALSLRCIFCVPLCDVWLETRIHTHTQCMYSKWDGECDPNACYLRRVDKITDLC